MGERQRNDKLRAAAGPIQSLDFAADCFDKTLYQRKSKAGSSRWGGRPAIKFVKHTRKRIRIQAGAAICHGQKKEVRLPPDAQSDRGSGRSMDRGIGQKIHQGLLKE